MTERTDALVERMLSGDRLALAKLMTLVENRAPETTEVMSRLHDHGGQSYVVGITGPPGAGKSTLLDCLVTELRAAGQTIGIVAVDPSSPFSGGAVLGDRIRMQSHFLDEGVFIRSLSARGRVGGLASAARDVARLLDAFGKDTVFVETVGVGQGELDVMRLANSIVVVLVPGAGDTIQAMKAGLLEIADVFVVNKADREGAERIKSELEMMLQLRPTEGWDVPVLLTVATNGTGVGELVRAIGSHRNHLGQSGEGVARATAGRREEFLAVLRDEIGRMVEEGIENGALGLVLAKVERGELDPYGAVLEVVADEQLLQAIMKKRSSPK